MQIKIFENKKLMKAKEAVVSLLTPVAVLAFVCCLCGIMYDTNDDRIISGLISGEITGSPSLIEYCGSLITIPLSLFYHIFPGADIWGLFLIAVFIISNALITVSLCRISGNLPAAVLADIALLMSALYMIAEINFTGIAMIAAMAGYVVIASSAHGDEKGFKKAFVIFFIMELIAVCIRRDSMLLIQPFGLTLYAGMLFVHADNSGDEGFVKKYLPAVKKTAISLAALIPVILIFFAGNALSGKNDTVYKEYSHFNDFGTVLFDYLETPVPYEKVRGVLEGTDITESMWDAMTEYTAFDWNEDAEVYEKVESALKAGLDHPDLMGVMNGIIDNSFMMHSFWLAVLLWLSAFFICFIKGMRRFFIPVCAMMVPHLAAWGYIVYMGRILKRVQIPLFMCEALVITAILFYEIRALGGVRRLLKGRAVLAAFSAFMIFAFLGTFMIAQGQYEECAKANAAKKSLVTGITDTAKYCSARPDCEFILDINAFGNYFGGPFDSGFYKPSNYTLSGSWFTMMPDHAERLKKMILDGDEFYYIVMDYGEQGPDRIKGYSSLYYQEVTGRKPVLIDSYEASFGGTFLVYRF